MSLRARIVVYLLALFALSTVHRWWALPVGAAVYLALFWRALGRSDV